VESVFTRYRPGIFLAMFGFCRLISDREVPSIEIRMCH
jgi:hypothetical protein